MLLLIIFNVTIQHSPKFIIFPYTTLFRSMFKERNRSGNKNNSLTAYLLWCYGQAVKKHPEVQAFKAGAKLVLFQDVDRSEEHTSELQSSMYLVCRLLLEKKKNVIIPIVVG